MQLYIIGGHGHCIIVATMHIFFFYKMGGGGGGDFGFYKVAFNKVEEGGERNF